MTAIDEDRSALILRLPRIKDGLEGCDKRGRQLGIGLKYHVLPSGLVLTFAIKFSPCESTAQKAHQRTVLIKAVRLEEYHNGN